MTENKSALAFLTDKERLFVAEYAQDMNRLRAVKAAGYKGNDNVLNTSATKLMKKPKIRAALAEIGTKLDASLLTVERLADQLSLFINRDVIDFVDNNGYLIGSLKDLPANARQCIEGWEVEKEYDHDTGELTNERIKVKLVSKIKSVELAMKWKQMLLPAQNNVNINNNINFDWNKFYENPPDVVNQRMQERLSGTPTIIDQDDA